MPSLALQSLKQGSSILSIQRKPHRRSLSPTIEDEDRIVEDYIKQEYLDRIINKETAIMAIKSLTFDPLRGDIEDFKNFLDGINKNSLANRLMDVYADHNIGQNILKQRLELPSGKVIKGLRVNRSIYLIITNKGELKAKSFKTGKFAKIPEYIKKNSKRAKKIFFGGS